MNSCTENSKIGTNCCRSCTLLSGVTGDWKPPVVPDFLGALSILASPISYSIVLVVTRKDGSLGFAVPETSGNLPTFHQALDSAAI